MGYYTEQIEKELSKPPTEIAVIDPGLVNKTPITLYIEHHNHSSPKYTFKGENGEILFKGESTFSSIILYDKNDVPLVNIRDGLNYKVYFGKDKTQLLAEVFSKNSWVADKFSISYYNLVTENREILDFNMENTYRSAGVFVGKEKEDAPMICKIQRIKGKPFAKAEFSIEMAAGVEYIFMLAISIIFMDKYETSIQNMKKQHKDITYY
ncbi:hypothetical protein PIROE2DRAFT_11458 [Piromyces sp. E2]|nr:hypothetical protein PIROE2DRAFT_11458 [Piromyces sp. E2]|eukprot:OUM62305.1 hypothetical protein PIROE2DRAFT_11458 [Piromyces sp. E2]